MRRRIRRWLEEWSWRRAMRAELKYIRKRQMTLIGWRVISPSQQVDLGACNYAEALRRCQSLGRVAFTDFEHGLIFINTDLGQSSPDAPGRSGI